MKLALGKKFGFGSVEGSVGGGLRTESSNKEVSTFENETFNTVGGNNLYVTQSRCSTGF